MVGILTRYAFGDTIDDANSLARDRISKYATYRDIIVRQLSGLNKKELIPVAIEKPVGKPVYAYVNHSRWIADCEFCGGAEAVTKDGVFFCLSCLNAKNNNRARPVKFPDDFKAIEKELEKRKLPANRNWLIKETIADLRKELHDNTKQ